jgi:L-fuculose-phosphate aldolase
LSQVYPELRREVVACARRLDRLGYVPATSGNISVRLDAEKILVTPTGVPKSVLRPEQLVLADMRGRLVAGGMRVTSEIGLHLAVYRLRPDVRAVVHAHPPVATGFACAGVEPPGDIASEVVVSLDTIPLTSFFLPGSLDSETDLPPDLREAIRTRDASLLSNHGAAAWGKDLAEAAGNMEILEHYANIALTVHLLGRKQPLPESTRSVLKALGAKYRSRKP